MPLAVRKRYRRRAVRKDYPTADEDRYEEWMAAVTDNDKAQ